MNPLCTLMSANLQLRLKRSLFLLVGNPLMATLLRPTAAIF